MNIKNAVPIIERKPLTLTINGKKIGPIDVPVGMPMIEFLHEYLDLTGTHFGCGQGICHACTIMEIQQGNVIELTPIQQAFIENFSFQCGYCAPGFVTGATVFLDKLKKHPIKRAELEHAIEEALNEHICRCTGYVRYYEAVRKVALDTPGCVID